MIKSKMAVEVVFLLSTQRLVFIRSRGFKPVLACYVTRDCTVRSRMQTKVTGLSCKVWWEVSPVFRCVESEDVLRSVRQHEQEPTLRCKFLPQKLSVAQNSKKLFHRLETHNFMNTFARCSLRLLLILSPHLHKGLSSGFFPTSFRPKCILYISDSCYMNSQSNHEMSIV